MIILEKYISKNDSEEWFINTIDVAIDLDTLFKSCTPKDLQNELQEFIDTYNPRMRFQQTVEEIESDIMDYYFK